MHNFQVSLVERFCVFPISSSFSSIHTFMTGVGNVTFRNVGLVQLPFTPLNFHSIIYLKIQPGSTNSSQIMRKWRNLDTV